MIETDTDMVERVARAIWFRDYPIDESLGCKELYLEKARAAIAAMREPTPEMIEAGCRAIYGSSWDGPIEKRPGEAMKDVWRQYPSKSYPAMIDAALSENQSNG